MLILRASGYVQLLSCQRKRETLTGQPLPTYRGVIPRPAGGRRHLRPAAGGRWLPPSLTQLLLVVSENGKNVRKLVKIHFGTVSVVLALRSKLRSLRVIRGKKFLYMDIVPETPKYLGNYDFFFF